MPMTLEGKAKVRRVGNGLCIPLPTKASRDEGIQLGDEVRFLVFKPRPRDSKVFGSLRKYFRGVDLDKLMDEDRRERG